MLLSSLVLVTLSLAAVAAVRYTIIDVESDYIWGISNSGQYVSSAQTSGGWWHATLHSGAVTQDLGTLGGNQSWAYAINNHGHVVGKAQTSTANYHAFLYDGVLMQDLSTLPGGLNSEAGDINDSGQIVGGSEILNSGDTGITYPLHAFLYDGAMHDLGSLPNRNSSYATAINNRGQIVGGSENYDNSSSIGGLPTGNEAVHAFFYYDGTMHDLGALPGWENSFATDVNDAGQIVGRAEAATMGDGGQDPWRAFVYDGTTMLNLNDLIDPASGWSLYYAWGINNSGQIFGTGANALGQSHSFLLEPVPEPSSMVCLGTAILVLVSWQTTRKRRGAWLALVAVAALPLLFMERAMADNEVNYDADPAGGPHVSTAGQQLPVTNDPPLGYKVLPAFPHFWWSYGCFPTCGAMIVGYYDNAGFPNMFRQKLGSSDSTAYYVDCNAPFGNRINDNRAFLKSGDDPYMYRDSAPYGSRCAISASEAGVFGRPGTYKGHVDDYVGGSDPYYTTSQQWPPHADDCMADYMGTSISQWHGRPDGDTKGWFYWEAEGGHQPGEKRRWVPPFYGANGYPNEIGNSDIDGAYGLARYIAVHAGYYSATGHAANDDEFDDVFDYYNQPILGYVSTTRGVTEADIKNEIDAGRPVIAVVVRLTSSGDDWVEYSLHPGYVSHAVVVYGYKQATPEDPLWMLIYDTWDEDQRGWMSTSYREVEFPDSTEVAYQRNVPTITSFVRESPNPDQHWKVVGFSFLKINDCNRCDAPLADVQTCGDTVHANEFDLAMTGQGEQEQESFANCTKVYYDSCDPTPASSYVNIINGTATLHIDRDCSLNFRTFKDVNAPDGYIASKVVRRVYSVFSSNKNIKKYADDTEVTMVNGIVTHVIDSNNFCFEERDERLFGIRVHKVNHGLDTGDEVEVVGGAIETDLSNDERYIEATSVTETDPPTKVIKPYCMSNICVGGKDFLPPGGSGTGYGQKGVVNSASLNNIGLLVRTVGKVTYINTSSGYFTISDASKAVDSGSHDGVKISAAGFIPSGLAVGDFVTAAGICSTEKVSNDLYPLIIARDSDDLLVVQ